VNKDQAITMKSSALKLMEEMAENVTVLEAHGRLDSTTAQQFGDRLVALVQAGRSAILVDLKNIIYISSAGFQALLIANRATAESQGKLALCGVIGGVKRLFEISSLTDLFLICQTRADGIAKLKDDRQNSSRPENRYLDIRRADRGLETTQTQIS
jgi:anti-sigma B factor antagonist